MSENKELIVVPKELVKEARAHERITAAGGEVVRKTSVGDQDYYLVKVKADKFEHCKKALQADAEISIVEENRTNRMQ